MPLDRSVGNYFDSSGSFIRRVARWKGPNPYVAGGELADAAAFGLGKIVAIFFSNMSDGTTYRIPAYSIATGKIMVFTVAGVEIAGGVDLSTFVGSVEVIGQ